MSKYRLPAEWEPHEATWLAWPHLESDWPGKLECARWTVTEIVRLISEHERVELLCHDKADEAQALDYLSKTGVLDGSFRTHLTQMNRGWLRDTVPTAVLGSDGVLSWISWSFNAWAKYDNYELDRALPDVIKSVTGRQLVVAQGKTNQNPIVLEGGVFDTDGEGTLIVTEECLLSSVQERNPEFSRGDYEAAFQNYLGIKKTIWLKGGIVGDDTHGHVDDVCRYIAPGRVVLPLETDTSDDNYSVLEENLYVLKQVQDAQGRSLEVIRLPMPRPVHFEGERLPASYANFYIANNIVLVPVFNDPADSDAISILSDCFPDRDVVGVYCRDMVLGLGTLHCLTHEQPRSQTLW